MGQAEVISLDEVRASQQWVSLRQQLHDDFDQWLDQLQGELPNPETTLAQITEMVWALRQDLTGSLTETVVEYAHRFAYRRKEIVCETCQRILTTHGPPCLVRLTPWLVVCGLSAPIFTVGCAVKVSTRSMRR